MAGTAETSTERGAGKRPGCGNPALDNIYDRRSVRSYRDDRVPNEIIGEIMRAGTFAPTAMNQQPWRFVVIRNREMIKRYAQRAKKLWAEQNRGSTDPRVASLARVVARPDVDIFYGAPVLILVFAVPDAYHGEIDCALAAQNMMLAARSMGIGSCWIGLAMPLGSDGQFLDEIGVPAGYRLVAPLIFGYPAREGARAPPRNNDVVLKWID